MYDLTFVNLLNTIMKKHEKVQHKIDYQFCGRGYLNYEQTNNGASLCVA